MHPRNAIWVVTQEAEASCNFFYVCASADAEVSCSPGKQCHFAANGFGSGPVGGVVQMTGELAGNDVCNYGSNGGCATSSSTSFVGVEACIQVVVTTHDLSGAWRATDSDCTEAFEGLPSIACDDIELVCGVRALTGPER